MENNPLGAIIPFDKDQFIAEGYVEVAPNKWHKDNVNVSVAEIDGKWQCVDFSVNIPAPENIFKRKLSIEDQQQLHDALTGVLIAPRKEKPKSPWIPVTERLPEAKGRYFVLTKWGDAIVGDVLPLYDFEKEKHEMRFLDYVTHWMPIPELTQ